MTGQALAWGVSAAGLLQFLMLWFACRHAGMWLTLKRPRLTPSVRRLVALGIPGTIAGGVAQLNLVISTVIASFEAGAASWLYYADRVYQLPLGIVGVAVGTVLLPELSQRLRAGDGDGVHASQNRALELALFLTVPAAMGLMALAGPIVNVLFERGAFTAADTAATAGALAAFAAGLPAFVMTKVFSPGFFAREDTRTPMNFAILGVAINIAGALALFPFLSHVGIAAATSLAAWVNALLLGLTLQRRGGFAADERLKRAVLHVVFASLAMGGALLAAMQVAAGWFAPTTGISSRAALLLALVAAGALVYFVFTWFSGVFRPAEFARAFGRR
jgi:putative peptidoglycan lipid II flippase